MSRPTPRARKHSIHRRVAACAVVVATGLPFLTACSAGEAESVEKVVYTIARSIGFCAASSLCRSGLDPDSSESYRHGN